MGVQGHFRFEDLEIWRDAVRAGHALFDMAEALDNKKLYRFAEQLRGAALSISNNIAEGSGSSSKREFSNFLNIARRSVFECANMVLVFQSRKHFATDDTESVLKELDVLSRRIWQFKGSL